MRFLIAPLALSFLLALGCGRTRTAEAQPDPEPPPVSDGQPEVVAVQGDSAALVVQGNPSIRRPIVHLHGMCEHPRANLDAWGSVAKEHGTIIAIVGDVPCPGSSGVTKWSEDATKLDARISAALDAVNADREVALDTSEVLVVGESMGAARAESLAKVNPRRYPRLVLVGSPQVVSASNVRGTRAIANVVGEREPQDKARAATRALTQAGVDAQFFELAGASHGAYGPDGARTMSEAIAFVANR